LGCNERFTEDLREAGLPARADAVIEYPFASVHESGCGAKADLTIARVEVREASSASAVWRVSAIVDTSVNTGRIPVLQKE
jgi:hypothetical protein